jgi:hypothetical protein
MTERGFDGREEKKEHRGRCLILGTCFLNKEPEK